MAARLIWQGILVFRVLAPSRSEVGEKERGGAVAMLEAMNLFRVRDYRNGSLRTIKEIVSGAGSFGKGWAD